MRKLFSLIAVVAVCATFTGCKSLSSGTLNLDQVAVDSGLTKVTTGDGTFENYKVTGYHTELEVGIAIGIPFLVKLIEVLPLGGQSDEEQVGVLAEAAKANGGATALINVKPPDSFYTGLPLGFIGIYIDRTEGTGVAPK